MPDIADILQRFQLIRALSAKWMPRLRRKTRLYVEMVSGPEPEALLGDVVTQNLPAIMASVCGQNIAGVKALIEEPAIDESVRGAALEALVRLVVAGKLDRDSVMQYFSGLFQTLGREPGQVWTALANCCLNLFPEEVTGEIEQAFEDELIDALSIAPSDIERALALGKPGAISQLQQGPLRQTLINDVEKEMSWMSGFDPRPPAKPALKGIETVVRSAPKIGRNDRCSYGSGRKFKKCCGF